MMLLKIGGCPGLGSRTDNEQSSLKTEEKLETRAFQIWSYEQRKAWPTD
jgi:hypothetical protein